MSVENDTIVKSVEQIKKPNKWMVVLHNDDVTPMNFVIELLYHVFNLKIDQATQITLRIHNEGRGVAGIYPFDIAEQKYHEALDIIRLANVPLKITLEET